MGRKKDDNIGKAKPEGMAGVRQENLIDAAEEEKIRVGLANAYDRLEDHPVTLWELVLFGADSVDLDPKMFNQKELEEMKCVVGQLGYLTKIETLYKEKIIELKKKAEERLETVPRDRDGKVNWHNLKEWANNERTIWKKELHDDTDLDHYFDFMVGDVEHVFKPGMMTKFRRKITGVVTGTVGAATGVGKALAGKGTLWGRK